jgi:1-acyl-sn-glycerol-3-phosphate acyltransferase
VSAGLRAGAGTAELPPSAARRPARYLLHPLRPLARWIIRRRIDVRVVDGEKMPARGPVILASNHVGVADGPLLAIFAPRPVHALTKQEMFRGFMNRFLLSSGQIPLDRFHPDLLAVRRCLRVLRDGGVVGIFPEGARGAGEFDRFHTGAAYLAMVTGAPVVPVVQFGTREPGAGSGALPPKGVEVEMVFGDPITIPQVAWPRRKRDVAARSLELREHLLAHLDHAKQLTGRSLPGPLPAKDADPDPATGVTDQEAS